MTIQKQTAFFIVFTCLVLHLNVCAIRKTRRSLKNQIVAVNNNQQPILDPLRSKKESSDLHAIINTDIQQEQSNNNTNQASIETNTESIFPDKVDEENLALQNRSSSTPNTQRDEKPYIQFNFENADLTSLLKQIEAIFDVMFITDEVIDPITKGNNALKGHKITFSTHKPLSKEDAWGLFLTFLDIAGFMVVPQSDPKLYRIITATNTLQQRVKAPVYAYIGTPYEELPETDETIRYVYFVENSTLAALTPIIEALKSRDSQLLVLQENKAIILIDKSYNIKMLMRIVKELDKSTVPQAMSILKLTKADAIEVKKFYDALIQSEQEAARRIMPTTQRKQPTSLYFPENTRIIAEPRTNSLILLGQQESIKKIEEFIIKNVDTDLDQPYYQPYVYTLKYADAKTIADIMNKVTVFGKGTPAGIAGGVRGGDKYLQPITFIPQMETNQLIIKGGYDDYVKAKEIIIRLDEPQPQVAIEVLILDVTIQDEKSLGAQLRSKNPGINGFWGNNIKFQTSGLFGTKGIEQNQNGLGVDRLLGNLVNLVIGAAPGNTILTLGQDLFGVWGIMQMLEKITNVQIISNPFLVATNKTKATVSVGEVRRVVTGTVTSGSSTGFQSQGDDDAKLEVIIAPQITSDGMITLDFEININTFTDPDPTSATKNIKTIKSTTIVADKEVLALGGLIKNTTNNNTSKVPLLGNIPILGWLFKNKQKIESKTNLLVLISTQIIRPDLTVETQRFTNNKVTEYRTDKNIINTVENARDPVHRLFFADKPNSPSELVDEYLFRGRKQEAYNIPPISNPPTSTTNTPEKVVLQKAPEPTIQVSKNVKRSRRSKRQSRLAHNVGKKTHNEVPA